MTQREVVLEGGLPWGFRMHGGSDTKTPLKISRVNPGSKAAQRGVREGDLITTINGQNTRNLTNNEAHNLLKTSGSTLRLGLNEDTEGSPKRRLIKTVRQENHQETIQKSSTLYSLKETIESLPKKQQNNESGQTKQHRRFVNGQEVKENGGNAVVVTNVPVSQRSTSSSSSISTPSTLIPEGKTFSTDQAEVSRQSSYSNCSSIPDEGGKEGDETEVEDMNDGQERISKSKRRRQRRKNLLHRSTSQENRPVVEINEVTEETIKELPEETEEEEPVKSPEPDAPTKNIEILKLKRIEHKYKVESPKELKIEQIKSKDKKLKAKSKSLDDDDLLKIQELSEASESEDTKLPPDNVVISEASSEENLIENSQREKRSALSTISLRLNDENEIETISRISCQEEQQLRNFLGGLKLIDSPEESAKEVYERTNETENSKTKKHQARKELEQYFLPMAQNPRFLDAISEEASDISDKESQAGFHAEKNPKQGTPELEIKPPPIPPRRNKSKLLEMYASHPEQPEAVLVETKIIDTQNVLQDICGTTTLAKSPEIAEIVYIDESSDSSRSSNEQIDCISSNLKESQEAETNSQKTDVSSDIFHVQANESTTTTFSSHVTSNSNILKPTENAPTVVDAALLSELTPPPSPENNKSQNHKSTDGSVLKHILFDYTRVPNVLTQKEPDSGFKSLKRNDVECYRSELNTNSIKTVETNTETKSLSSLHSSKEIVNGEIKNIDVIKVKVDERTQNGNSEIYKSLEEYNNNTDSKSSEDNNTPKKLDENVLKHIMMVSKDSNKTDNEKLLEFQSICKLNSELKDKISKQERFGAMRSQIINEKLKKDVEVETEEENEYAPTKNLVQRRVKEFSRQISDEQSVNVVTETERKNSSLIQSRVAQFSETGESLDKINRDDASLVKNLIPSENDNVNKIDEDTGSVLKKILLSREKEDTIFSIPTKEEENKELVVPIKVEKDVSSSETEVIPIKIEQQSESVKKDQHLQGKSPNKETIIPITIEENDGQKKLDNSISKTNENIKEINKYMENISTNEKSIEITSCDHVERNIPTQIEDPKDTSIKELKNTSQSVEDVAINKNLIETESVDDIKKNIPIRAEDFSIRSIKEHKNIRPSVETLSAHHQLTSSSSVAPVERNIPVKIEYSNLETGKKLRDISKSMDNLTINKHPERNIPIKIQHSDLKTMKELKGISKSIENISVKELFNDSKSAVSVVRNIPIRIEDSSSKILKDLNNISKSVENIPINIYLLETKSIVQRNNSDTASKLMKETKDVSKSLENLSTSRRVLETESIKPMERNIPIEIEDSGSKIIKDITQNITLNKKMDETKPARNVERYIPIKTEDSMHEKTATKPSANIERIIPVKIDDASEKSIKKLKGTSKSLENISLNTKLFETKTASKVERHIPIEIEANSSKSVKNEQGEEDKRIPENQETVHMNVLSPPRRDSVSSESSGESSRCTAKYNPNSSIADISSLTKEEQSGGIKILYEPMSLRSIVLNLLVSLPFGEEILKELADVSKTIESYTNKLPYIFNKILPRKDNVNKISAMPSTWYTEKDIYHNQSEQNNRKLIEHQEHFYTRRKSEGDNIVERENEVMSPNRLLTIIREEPTETEASNKSIRLEDNSRKRLKAKNLGEWLTLARNKSKSTSQLDSTNIPINNLRRTFSNTEPDRARFSNRRSSLPQEIYEQQLWSIMEKEREIQRELGRLEDEKRKIQAELAPSKQKQFQVNDFFVSKKGDFAEFREQEPRTRPASMPVFPTEYFRQQMYNEYMDKFTEREERKQQKVIKISSSNDLEQDTSFCMKSKEIIHPVELEKEFMDKVKSKKLGRSRGDTDDNEESDDSRSGGKTGEPPVIVLDGDQVKGVDVLPRHLREFVDDLENYQDDSIWSPGQQHPPPTPRSKRTDSQNSQHQRDEPISPVWAPKSASSSPIVERKEFRSVNFRSPVLSRKNRTQSESLVTPDRVLSEPPWKLPEGSSDAAINLSSTLDRRLPNSQSSPGFGSYSTTPRLPRAQNPTITLLQKAREGQLPRGAQYIDQERKPPNDRPPIKYPGEVLYHIKNEYTSESDSEKPRKMADLAPRKFEGIGPTTKDGMPLILRSEVKDRDQSKWYKRMYDTIHKQKPHRDEFVTIKYRQKRAQYPYTSGYLSEPEPGAYDSDFTEYKYATLDRRRPPETNYLNTSAIMSRNITDKSYSSSDIVKNTQETFKIQPGKIENYVPGHSSISEKEAKKWWDEVMDIFDGHLEQQSRIPPQKPRSFINQALKESGYESDSTLIFKRKEDTANQLSPKEQREAYKIIQKGGDVPFQGLRKLAPERPKEPEIPPPPTLPQSLGEVQSQDPESPRKYVENEVTIHYKTPVRTEIKEYVSEDELAYRQAEAMKKIYEEEKRRKQIQELQDMRSRRHTDNFVPSQKSPISLNRYDDFDDLTTTAKIRPRSPEPRLVAKALYNFVGHTARELTFRKGELIYLRRQIDKNWYEGELNAMVGLFPVNYVEIVPYEGVKTVPRKAHEGQARAKYNFLAQTHLELSLAKGELVTVTRKVDDNWFEGKIGGRKGIFPVAYVEVLIDPSVPSPPSTKPVASPAAHSLLLNGSAQGKESMGSHLYTPNLPNPLAERESGFHRAKPVQLSGAGTYTTLPKSTKNPLNQTLHIETQSEPIPYRALYKYTPQNDDELELLEGDTVYVLEKCDDGWYVGSSDRTGGFGTFPGNYVEKI